MIATTHLAVGAAVGLWGARLAGAFTIYNPPFVRPIVQTGVAFLAGALSHFMLDAIPHNDGIYKTALGTTSVLIPELAVVFSIILGLVLSKELDPVMVFAGMAGAAWFDLFDMLGIAVPIHEVLHSAHKPGLVGSMIVQLIIAIVALLFLF